MNVDLLTEEMNYFGASFVGRILTEEQVDWFKEDLLTKKKEDIDQFGEAALLEYDYETVRDLARFGKQYHKLIENEKINLIINTLLNDKAVIHSYNGIINFPNCQSKMIGFNFHRDQPYFGDVRTSFIMMIPLVDFYEKNGATQYISCSHAFKNIPSEDFQKKHFTTMSCKAGEAYVVDASTWHRAGKNISQEPRPMLTIKYTLAPFKQQIDFCESAADILSDATELVKQRLGWDVRVSQSYSEFRVQGAARKFKSGQYDMSNTSIKRQ